MKTLLLGLGSSIMKDDGIGVYLAKRLKQEFENVEATELNTTGLGLIEVVRGYERVFIIDAIKTKNGKIGEFYKLSLKDLEISAHLPSSHTLGLPITFAMGRKLLPKEMPKEVVIFAIEVEDVASVSEEFSESLQKKLPHIVATLKDEIANSIG